ncbi:MAG: 4-hydroxybenzoate octaprenyltransferase [Betaproteobacteria bacterium]|jgi:4-hydroxybenzoate octaprenyltransferase (EC 2.5.1.-)|nr:4-hydroxybenzoate octaprenyltransferase [Betaproteobacteria bacterium]
MKWKAYWRLARMDKPIGTLLLLWPTLWALWLASHGHPHWDNLVVFILGTWLMRSAGCVINDVADRRIDIHVKRTALRPLATGEVSTQEALLLTLALSIMAFLLVLTRNTLTLSLSIPALFLAASYPFTKRFFPLPQAYLGIAFGFGIPMAWAAETQSVPELAWWLMSANLFWTLAYDTEYAMVDRDDDLHLGIHSSALLFGNWEVRWIMLFYSITLCLLAYVGHQAHLNFIYKIGLGLAAGIALYHFFLIRNRDRNACFRAFLHNNWFGGCLFAAIVLATQ